jgi:WXG100 family type VII secretion target
MASDVIRIDYEVLDNITRSFEQQADQCQEMFARLRQRVDPLENGGWAGEGATAFFQEMNTGVLPALQRLSKALVEGASVSLQTAQVFKEAEEGTRATSALFPGGIESTTRSNVFQIDAEGAMGGESTAAPPEMNVEFEAEVLEGKPPSLKETLKLRRDILYADIKVGEVIADRIIANPVEGVKKLASLPENPLSMEMDPSDVKDLFEQAYKDPAKGLWSLMKVPLSGIFEMGRSTRAKEVAAARRRYYAAYADGVAGALDPSWEPPGGPPTDEWERRFFEVGKRAAQQLTPLERYQASLALVKNEQNRGFGLEHGLKLAQSQEEYIATHLNGSICSSGMMSEFEMSDRRYR